MVQHSLGAWEVILNQWIFFQSEFVQSETSRQEFVLSEEKSVPRTPL
jgi:hypothetical protein